MFEHRKKPLLPKPNYLRRVLRNFLWAGVLLLFSLMVGILGYHFVGGLSWIDSFLNSSMILTGMGPVNPMPTNSAKLFSGFYALFSGIAFITIITIMLAPVVHRFMHKFHFEENEEK